MGGRPGEPRRVRGVKGFGEIMHEEESHSKPEKRKRREARRQKQTVTGNFKKKNLGN